MFRILFCMVTVVLITSESVSARNAYLLNSHRGKWVSVSGSNGGDNILIYERFIPGYYDWATGIQYRSAHHLVVEFQDRDGKTILKKEWPKAGIYFIAIVANDGMDWIEVDTDIDCDIHTGGGFDFVIGGSGDDRIFAFDASGGWINGGPGDDLLVTRYSLQLPMSSSWQTLEGGPGRDEFIYNPNDTLIIDEGVRAGWQVQPDWEYHSGMFAGFLRYRE